MIKQLPLVIFREQNQLFALEASFVGGQGRTDFLEANAQVLPFSDFLMPKAHRTANQAAQFQSKHWLRLAGSLKTPNNKNPWLLGIESDAELIELPANQIHALPALLKARREFVALQAVAWYQQQLVSLIDARVLLTLAHPLLAPLALDANQDE